MKLRFKSKQLELDDIWSFFFEPLKPLEWQAGQSIRLEIPKSTWGTDERRFTIASAPYEKLIRITTKIGQSSFKQSLDGLKEGAEIQGYNVEGEFLWQDDDKPRLMLAGGIGITAFRTLLAQAVHDKKQLNTTVIYSSKEVPALFSKELDKWRKKDPSLYIHYLVGGRFSIQEDSTLASFWLTCNAYISGPEAMVNEVATALLKQGLPEDQLFTDLFTGL